MSKEFISGKFEVVDHETACSLIGEGVHTGLRKGSDAPNSAVLWRGISDSTDSAWPDAVEYCLYGLESMGYKIVRAVDA